MKIRVQLQIPPWSNIDLDLPDFTLITGINGSGKTQLLKSIQTNSYVDLGQRDSEQISIRYVPVGELFVNEESDFSTPSIVGRAELVWQLYEAQRQPVYMGQVNFHESLMDIFLGNPDLKLAFQKIAKVTGKIPPDVTKEDFENYYQVGPSDLFRQNLATQFKLYNDRNMENKFRRFLSESEGEDIEFWTDMDFVEKFGVEPWLLFNEMLESMGLPYEVQAPIYKRGSDEYKLKLFNKLNGTEHSISALSSGEKILLAIGLALYEDAESDHFPKVLLLDEPDAFLHPSMAKQL